MKKLVMSVAIVAIMFSLSLTAFAGDVPEVLLGDDNAMLFIGTVNDTTLKTEDPLSSVAVIGTADITPTLVIKGDIEAGVSKTFEHCDFGSLIPEKNKEYLFGYIDENNFYIYEIESRDENNIKLVGSDKEDMTNRLEVYLNDGSYAMAEEERKSLGSQISFVEFLYKKPSLSSSAIEKITLRYQDEVFEVDKDEFFKTAESIMITNVKNDTLYEIKADPDTTDAYKTILYIELLDSDERVAYFGAVSRYGEVDNYSLFMSRLMAKDYEMKPEDLEKLYALFPEDIRKDIQPAMPLPAGDVEPLASTEKLQKNNTVSIIAIVVLLILIVLTIFFIIRKKNGK